MGDLGVQKKKLNKNKLKKTIKNVLCRPDPLPWPEVSSDHKNSIESALSKHKVELPVFEKPHWNKLKLIPKEERPKPPNLEKVDGLIFGVRECSCAIESKQCSAIIIESMVNPRAIVQPVIEACNKLHVPFICCKYLRETTVKYFGVPTSSLGIKLNSLPELTNTVLEIAKNYTVIPEISSNVSVDVEMKDVSRSPKIAKERKSDIVVCPYLYRSNKKSRVFVPGGTVAPTNVTKDFIAQNYIEFSDKSNRKKLNSKKFKKMIVKRISSNPDRVKIKKD